MNYIVLMGILFFALVAINVVLRFLPLPSGIKKLGHVGGSLVVLGLLGITFFNGAMFYAEPGYNYHIRTIAGTESISTTTGWKLHLFGRYEPWKKAISIVSTSDASITASNKRGALRVIMLDKVDGDLSTSVRYRMPDGEEQMLRLAREYRTQENFVNTALIPAIDRTMNASAQLMSAEDFFNGGRSEFDTDFEYQMRNGLYKVERREREVEVLGANRTRRNPDASSSDTVRSDIGEETKVIFEVVKLLDDDGQFLLSPHNFNTFGVNVEEAIVTDFDPNEDFKARMRQIQEASAARAQAREQRIQEEEQKLYAIAKGEREAAESEAAALKAQIQQTTEAETRKRLALIDADRQREQAAIAKETSEINLEKARLDAEARRVAAEAEAYAKEAVLAADNALAEKLAAEIEIQKVWAQAFAQRKVPSTVFVTGGEAGAAGTPTGSNTELASMVQLMTMDLANRLDYDRNPKVSGN